MKLLLPFFFLLIFNAGGFACSTFCLKMDGQILFGRNYDWVSGAGLIHINKKGLNKTSFAVKDGKQLSWQSKYGSITFNQYGKEFPTGGMNEKGLVVELMWLDATRFPKPDDRAALMVLQWIQYQLDNAATIDEVIASDKKIRISSSGTPLHYLIADGAGSVATIEFLDGKLVVHKGDQLEFPVLTNTVYATARTAGSAAIASRDANIAGDNSVERFATACRMINDIKVQKKQTSLTDEAFNILKAVSQGDFTKWSIVYNISEKKIDFITSTNNNRRTIRFDDFNFECNSKSLMYNLTQADTGTIKTKFVQETDNTKSEVLRKAAADSREYVQITEDEVISLLRYAQSISCK